MQSDTGKYIKVLFRDLVKEIPSTTYATHGLYMYPAKFIPHITRFAINMFTSEGDWVFDPFAGYGSVGIEASLTGRNFILWDLNPILDITARASLYRGNISPEDVEVDFNYSEVFIPQWSNLYYWHPRKFVDVLGRAWGYYHYCIPEKLKPVAAIPLLKITRYFSYSDEKIPKLYRSRYAEEKVKKLLSSNWRKLMLDMYHRYVKKTISKIREFQSLNPKSVESVIRAGVDSLSLELDRNVKLMITSPPYLQAHEYIRSFKLELIWLGYSEDDVRRFSSLEIPYRKPPEESLESPTYRRLRAEIAGYGEKFLRLYDTYFKSLASFLNKNHGKTEVIALFLGKATIRGREIPVDTMLKEHLESLGWRHRATYIDRIKSRRLFKIKTNPATNNEMKYMTEEHLLVMTRE